MAKLVVAQTCASCGRALNGRDAVTGWFLAREQPSLGYRSICPACGALWQPQLVVEIEALHTSARPQSAASDLSAPASGFVTPVADSLADSRRPSACSIAANPCALGGSSAACAGCTAASSGGSGGSATLPRKESESASWFENELRSSHLRRSESAGSGPHFDVAQESSDKLCEVRCPLLSPALLLEEVGVMLQSARGQVRFRNRSTAACPRLLPSQCSERPSALISLRVFALH
eukprot:3072534-Pleurochrysis_carterae.AAC.1